jgi:hypothetical protein
MLIDTLFDLDLTARILEEMRRRGTGSTGALATP